MEALLGHYGECAQLVIKQNENYSLILDTIPVILLLFILATPCLAIRTVPEYDSVGRGGGSMAYQ